MAKVNWFAQNVLKKVGKGKFNSLRKAGSIVRREARALCSVGIEIEGTAKSGKSAGQAWTERTPGSLKKTIRFQVSKDGSGVRVKAGSKLVFYARFVEFGTEENMAIPYLRPALHKQGAKVLACFEGQMEQTN